MLKWVLILLSLVMVGFMCLFILGGPDANLMEKIIKSGFLPRAISWICLILGVYGLARRRFSPMMMFMLFAFAFFFTYLGQFILKEMY